MKIYAVDFDGTLCESKYPKIGKEKKDIVEYVKNLKAKGNKLILWTCRTDDKLTDAIEWCEERGLTFDAVNENLPEKVAEYNNDPRKIAADHYIDDKNLKLDDCIAENDSNGSRMEVKTMKKFWEIKQQASVPDALDLYIYSAVEADSFDWWNGTEIKSETSADYFREQLAEHEDVKQINLYINSLGGSVKEGVAIYNQLRRHPANVTAYIDGFACSIASVIAMAADKIIMPRNAVMMIHNAWAMAIGNAKELRKAADDLDVLNEASRQAYLVRSGGKISEDKLVELLDAETYLTAEQCMEYGFADEYSEKDVNIEAARQALQSAKETGAKQYTDRIEKVCALARTIDCKAKAGSEPTPAETVTESFMKYFK